ncbi:hypothetical protein AB1484_07250 [Parafrankia sp. FMc6]|uniref:hypothetical protein n=1 Tax=Parafrankia soli TaxID=2599596 RepID=UPI0034D785E8
MTTAIGETTDASSRTAGFVLCRTEQLLIGADPPVVLPSRWALYRLFVRLAHGRHTTGSARARRRSLAARPDGPFPAVTVTALGDQNPDSGITYSMVRLYVWDHLEQVERNHLH